MNQVRPHAAAGPGDLALALGLGLLLAWPATAIFVESWRGATGDPSSGGLIDSALTSFQGRPLGLAIQTLRVTLAAELLALPAGTILAFLLARTDLAGRRIIIGLLAMSLFVPMPLHATAWLGALGNAGRLQALGTRPLLLGWKGAAFVHAMAALPWVILVVGAGFRAVESELEEAAALEMPGARVGLLVTLRRTIGPIAAAALAVAVLTAGDMTVTDLLQVRTYAEEAYIQSQLGGGPAAALRVAVPPLLVLGTAIVLGGRTLRQWEPARVATARTRGRTWRLGGWRVPLGVAWGGLFSLLLGTPLYGLLWRAGRVSGRAAGGQPPHWSISGLGGSLARAWPDIAEPSLIFREPLRSPLVSSTLWAAAGASLAVVLGGSMLWKARRSRVWRGVTVAVVAVTLAAPGPIVGLALKLAFLPIAAIHDTGLIVILAYTVRALPFAVLILGPALLGLAPEHLDAAAVDGYRGVRLIVRVAIPLSRPAIVAAWFGAFVIALGELPTSNLVLPAGATTLTSRVWMLLHTGVESHLAGVGLLLIGLYALMSGAAAWLLRRAMENER